MPADAEVSIYPCCCVRLAAAADIERCWMMCHSSFTLYHRAAGKCHVGNPPRRCRRLHCTAIPHPPSRTQCLVQMRDQTQTHTLDNTTPVNQVGKLCSCAAHAPSALMLWHAVQQVLSTTGYHSSLFCRTSQLSRAVVSNLPIH
eukprot:364848-Chlamydomonas_euryale.AAC.17